MWGTVGAAELGLREEGLWGGWLNMTLPFWHYSVTDSVQLKACFDLFLFFECKTCDGAHACLIKMTVRFFKTSKVFTMLYILSHLKCEVYPKMT